MQWVTIESFLKLSQVKLDDKAKLGHYTNHRAGETMKTLRKRLYVTRNLVFLFLAIKVVLFSTSKMLFQNYVLEGSLLLLVIQCFYVTTSQRILHIFYHTEADNLNSEDSDNRESHGSRIQSMKDHTASNTEASCSLSPSETSRFT